MKLGETQPFASPQEALEYLQHHGVKGQRWGVRKEDDTQGGQGKAPPEKLKNVAAHNDATKEYISAAAKINATSITPKQAKAALAENHKKAAAKLAPSEAKGKSVKDRWNNLSSTQKKAIIYGVTTTALVGYVAYSGRQLSSTIPGAPVKPSIYMNLVGQSQMKTWMGQGHVTPSSFNRPAFELPAGHIFHRLSTVAEEGFGHVTYSTSSLDDFNRYSVGFRAAGGSLRPGGSTGELFHTTFKSTEPVKVPHLTEVLNTMKSILAEEHAENLTSSDITSGAAIKAYTNISGGWWDEPRAKVLISKLKAKGYGAIVDEMDAGVRADTPLVFFGGKTTPKTSTKLTKSDFKKFGQELREVADRK